MLRSALSSQTYIHPSLLFEVSDLHLKYPSQNDRHPQNNCPLRPGERSEEIAEDQKEENLYAICDEGQIRSLLGKRLGICPKRQLYLVGIGMGNEKNRTV